LLAAKQRFERRNDNQSPSADSCRRQVSTIDKLIQLGLADAGEGARIAHGACQSLADW